MVVHRSQPSFQIVTRYSGTNYTFTDDQAMSGKLIRLENGFDAATLYWNDYKSINYLDKWDVFGAGTDSGTITISFKDKSEASYTEVFDGIIRFINLPRSMEGETAALKCDGE